MSPDDPVVQRYLATSYVARVATRSRSGVPALTPLWFVADGGRLYTTTSQATLAARNAKADPAVAILLDGEGGDAGGQVLRLRGRARVHARLPSLRVLARFAWKYYLGGWQSELRHAGLWGLRQRYYAQGEIAVIEFAPESAELLRTPERAA